MRIGNDPATAPLDPYCRAYDHPNLYVVDASFLPTSAAVNPALTIAAQALRVADRIKREGFCMSRQRPVALVTGGRRGIGLGIARALAAIGFDLAITDRESDEAVIHELRGLGGKVAFFKSDLAAVETHEATVFAVLDAFGGIDCLVNNAGMGAVERGDFLCPEASKISTRSWM